jgi:hypothetical protein
LNSKERRERKRGEEREVFQRLVLAPLWTRAPPSNKAHRDNFNANVEGVMMTPKKASCATKVQ